MVPTTLTESIGRIRAQHGTKLIRFGAVSAFNVVFGQLMLYGAQVVLGWSPVASNVITVAIGTIPAYVLSRYWVWNKRGRSHFLREVVPFWVLTLIGFVLSTGAVWFVDSRWDPSPLMVNMVSLAAFGVVWVAKFVILDRLLFKTEEAAPVTPNDALL
jgi:putative flippase GtrA